MVSFDGLSGTGKTTQAKIVSKHYKLPFIDFRNHFYGWETGVNSFDSVARTFCNIARVVSSEPTEPPFVIDNFFLGLIRYLAYNDDDKSVLIHLMDHALRGMLGREPICFYLLVPGELAKFRKEKREYNIDKQETGKRFEWDGEDMLIRKVVDYMSNRLSYFHVIDGRLDVSKVSKCVFDYTSNSFLERR